MNQALKNLLDVIRSKEAPRGYGQIYGGAKGVSLATDVSKMKLRDVRALQDKMLKAGSASSAVGGYQFIKKTLIATMAQMKLTGDEYWTPGLQDQMAVHLMNGRGLQSYLAGRINAVEFANNLAKEWASLPVVSRIKGATRMVNPGETYYAGDGLNKAHHDPKAILKLVEALSDAHWIQQESDQAIPASPPDVEPLPPAAPPKPAYRPSIQLVMAVLAGIAALVATFFGLK